MNLKQLKQLKLDNNKLVRLPYTIGFVTTLQDLHLHDNITLIDPPASLLSKVINIAIQSLTPLYMTRLCNMSCTYPIQYTYTLAT